MRELATAQVAYDARKAVEALDDLIRPTETISSYASVLLTGAKLAANTADPAMRRAYLDAVEGAATDIGDPLGTFSLLLGAHRSAAVKDSLTPLLARHREAVSGRGSAAEAIAAVADIVAGMQWCLANVESLARYEAGMGGAIYTGSPPPGVTALDFMGEPDSE